MLGGVMIEFTKMHGLGNDFVVLDAITQKVVLDETQVRAVADRRFNHDSVPRDSPPRDVLNDASDRDFLPERHGGQIEQLRPIEVPTRRMEQQPKGQL